MKTAAEFEESQDEKQAAFSKYDWVADVKWGKYMSRVYPVPPESKLERMKRHWYKIYVDGSFEPEYRTPRQVEELKS